MFNKNQKDENEGFSYGTFKETEGSWESLKDDRQSKNSKVGYDDILEEIGEFGPWQQWQCLVYSIPPFVSGALFMLGAFTS